MKERVQKILARSGNVSRRGAERLIESGEVTVNGETVSLGALADPNQDDICVGGRRISVAATKRYVVLHKPLGVVSSLRSTHGEPTVANMIPLPERLFPVGRLDKDTSGLLLMTNDGDWAFQLLHPRYGVDREYFVCFGGALSTQNLLQLRQGVRLDDGTMTAPAEAAIVQQSSGNTLVRLRLTEGKKRQIRMMGVAMGHPVVSLHRVRFGRIKLGALPVGGWRHLTETEVELAKPQARSASVAVRQSTKHTSGNRRTGRKR